MSFKIYRYIFFIIVLITIAISIYGILNWNSPLLLSTILSVIAQDTSGNISKENISNEKKIDPPIPVSLEDIISKRYLYTLTREAEKKLSAIVGTGVILESNYTTFEDAFILGDNFIFHFDSGTVNIPVSSYFFDKLNQKPKTVVSGEISSNSGVLNQGNKKMIALTFDDGPSNKYTNILLDILKDENVKATFYILGSKAEQFPQMIQREHREGHEIGNHSYSHTLFTKISQRMMQEEIYKTDQAIYKAIGVYPRTFRPPYGGTNSGILNTVGMPAILWSIDPRDWKTLNIQKNTTAIANAKDGDIIIMHDIHKTSVASISEIIKNLKAQGFTFVTVSELLSLSDTNTEIGKKCTKKGSCI